MPFRRRYVTKTTRTRVPFVKRRYKRKKRNIPKRLKPEVKSQYHIQEPKIVEPKATGVNSLMIPFPTLEQGTGQNNRIGNRINALTLRVAGMLTQKFINTTGKKTTRIGVRMVVCQSRRFPNGDLAIMAANASQWIPYVVDLGNTGGYLDGTCNRYYAPLNKDVVKVWADKKFIMTCPYIPDQTGDDEQQTAGGTWHSVRPFKFNFKLNNVVRYGYGTKTHPSTGTPVILVSWCCLNGETLNNTEQELTVQYRSDLFYTDS